MSYYNVTVVIPSLNPDHKLKILVNELMDNGFDDIIIVNDGSAPEYLKNFPEPEKYPFCTVLTHRRNRGKGSALKTAFRFFNENREGRAGVITIDADGQHLTNDIMACTQKMIKENKVVLGCRNFSRPDVPKRSRFGNKMTSLVFRLFCGLKISDTQTGLRAIPAEYITEFSKIKGERYEYETNMLLEMKKLHIGYIEQPISTVYIEENKSSHFRPLRDSFRIYKLIFAFAFSSLISMLVELILFYLILRFFIKGDYAVAAATVIARIVSSILNFGLNRSRVFKGQNKLTKSLLRYVVLAIPLALASILSIEALSLLAGTTNATVRTLFKMVVDTILFFVSFRVQQNWVFAPEKAKNSSENNSSVSERPKKKLTAGRIALRSLACFGTAVLYLVITVLTLATIAAKGPSTTVRDALVLSAMQASATKWVPGLFLSDEEVQKIVDNSYVDTKLTIDMDDYTDNDGTNPDGTPNTEDAIDGMKYIVEQHDNFKAYILLVYDPSRLYVGTASSNFSTATAGKRIFDIVKQENCIAAINGGEFRDDGGQGTGDRPIGLTYSNGKCVWDDGLTKRTFIGIDNNNRLVVSEGMTKAKADSLGIRDAVSFQTGNVLIDSDESGVHLHYKQWNVGAAQRTAIGQRADGTFILVVTDGRTASSLGAQYNEMIDIMKSYGAVNAGLLDGGSSAMMYYENYFDKYGIDKSKLDEYQLRGLCNRYKAFSAPRRIPTFFCVSR